VTPEASWWAALDAGLEEALRVVFGLGQPPVVLFSGGVDSGLLAWELRRLPGTSLVTVGTEGAEDLHEAERRAPVLDVPWQAVVLDDPRLERVEREARSDLVGVPGPRRGIFVALAAAFAETPPGPLVCGQGADELFLGYAHYRGLSSQAAGARASADLDGLLRDDWPRTVGLARRWGHDVLAPYLHPAFVKAATDVPISARAPDGSPKAFLRAWAQHRGLPAVLADRPKRALQYGSGVDRWLRRRAQTSPRS
jgi:asparagine synthase (glutamine-hydrolysing)